MTQHTIGESNRNRVMKNVFNSLQCWRGNEDVAIAPELSVEATDSSDFPSSSSSVSANPMNGLSLFDNEEYFLKQLYKFKDLWKAVVNDPNIYICCPPSLSLNPKAMSKDILSTHILQPSCTLDFRDNIENHAISYQEQSALSEGHCFRNFLGECVKVVGNHLVLSGAAPRNDADGISAQTTDYNPSYNVTSDISHHHKRVKVIHADKRSLIENGPLVNIFYINRPFRGGILSPEEFDDIGTSLVHKYVAGLRCYPTMEAIFVQLDSYLKDLKALAELTNGQGYSRIRPSLTSSLRNQWDQSTKLLIKAAYAIGVHSEHVSAKSTAKRACSTESFGFTQYSDEHFGQIVETYMFKQCGKNIYHYLSSLYWKESESFVLQVKRLRNASFDVFGIKPWCAILSQDAAVEMLRKIRFTTTPVDKLLIMKQTVQLIYDRVNQLLSVAEDNKSQYSQNNNRDHTTTHQDLEFATDDLISILLLVIVNAYDKTDDQGAAMDLIVDLQYCQDFHFGASAKSSNAFVQCHFEVCIDWILAFGKDSPPSDATSSI